MVCSKVVNGITYCDTYQQAVDQTQGVWDDFLDSIIEFEQYKKTDGLEVAAAPLVALLPGGCGEEAVEMGEEDQCALPFRIKDRNSFPNDEKKYSDGSNFIIADKNVSKEEVNNYLIEMPLLSESVLDFFGIDSPLKNSFALNILSREEYPGLCMPDAYACAGMADMFFWSDCLYGQSLLTDSAVVHEASHALRDEIAEPWWGLEEGLAKYTEGLIIEGWASVAPSQPILLFKDIVAFGEVPDIDFSGLSLEYFFVKEIKDNSVVVAWSTQVAGHDTGITPHVEYETEYPLDQYSHFWDFVIYPSITYLGGVQIEVYEGSSSTYGIPVPLCGDEGIDYGYEEFFVTESGDHVFLGKYVSEAIPYFKSIHFVRDGLYPEYYITGFCFWDTIRENYGGHEAVKTIVQLMVEFSKEHQNAQSPFPFFQTFKDVTGMDDEEAKAYFEKFGAPTGDEWYKIGGVCW